MRLRRAGDGAADEANVAARLRPIPTVVVDEDAHPVDRLRLISTWSLAALAMIGVGAALYFARELLIPIVTAFVVGVMLSPVAKALEDKRVPRVVSAALIVVVTALLIAFVIALIASPVAELWAVCRRSGTSCSRCTASSISGGGSSFRSASIRRPPNRRLPLPSISWVPTTIGFVSPPVTGFLYFLVVLLLFISWWPDLRRQLVMTFASRDSRLTVLKILNELESALAAYLSDGHLHQSRRRRRGGGDRLR